MTRDNDPTPGPAQPSGPATVQPDDIIRTQRDVTVSAAASGAVPVQLAGPAPAVQQAAVGADVPAAIVRGVAQGAAQGTSKAFTARLTDAFLADPPDWVRALWGVVKGMWE
ncbi:hypothetical protein [Streptomyces zaomyceticus]|uniref:hypothetical protein n=1 Tax=Streptomyces zaomyceticus TaxID=68286 RepID=UPI003442ADAC